MAVASGRIAAPAAFAPTSRWRGKPAQVGAIVGLWLVAYFLLKGQDLGWPASLTWEELPRKLDDAQDWLLEQRTAANPNPVFAVLEGFRSLCEWLVTAFIDIFEWLTWIGTIAASVGGVRR